MSGRRTGHTHRAVAFAVLGFIGSALAIPMFVGSNELGTALSSASARDSYRITSPVIISRSPRVSLAGGTVSLAIGSRHNARDLAAMLGGRGIRLELNDPVFILGEGEAGAVQPSVLAPLVTALAQISFEALTIRRGTLRFGEDPSGAALEHIDADITVPAFAAADAAGAFDFRGQRVAFATTLAPGEPGHRDVLAIKARVSSALFNGNLDGSLTLGASPQLSAPVAGIAMTNLRQTANWLGVPWGSGAGLGSFSADGVLVWQGMSVGFQDARFRLDDNEAGGGLSLVFGGPVPSLEGTLAFTSLKLDPYLLTAAAPADDGSRIWASISAATDWFSPPAFSGIDADIRLSADQLTAGSVNFRRAAAALSLKGGRLNADVAELAFTDGSNGSGQICAEIINGVPRYDVRAKLRGLDMAVISQALFGAPALRGHGDLALDLASTGMGATALLSNLNGKAAVSLPRGAVLGFNASALRMASSLKGQPGKATGVGAAVGPVTVAVAGTDLVEVAGTDLLGVAQGATVIDGLEGRLQVANGIWTIEQLQMQAGGTLYSANGSVEPATKALDLIVLQQPESAGNAVAGTGAVALGVQVRGAWSRPLMRPLEAQSRAP